MLELNKRGIVLGLYSITMVNLDNFDGAIDNVHDWVLSVKDTMSTINKLETYGVSGLSYRYNRILKCICNYYSKKSDITPVITDADGFELPIEKPQVDDSGFVSLGDELAARVSNTKKVSDVRAHATKSRKRMTNLFKAFKPEELDYTRASGGVKGLNLIGTWVDNSGVELATFKYGDKDIVLYATSKNFSAYRDSGFCTDMLELLNSKDKTNFIRGLKDKNEMYSLYSVIGLHGDYIIPPNGIIEVDSYVQNANHLDTPNEIFASHAGGVEILYRDYLANRSRKKVASEPKEAKENRTVNETKKEIRSLRGHVIASRKRMKSLVRDMSIDDLRHDIDLRDISIWKNSNKTFLVCVFRVGDSGEYYYATYRQIVKLSEHNRVVKAVKDKFDAITSSQRIYENLYNVPDNGIIDIDAILADKEYYDNREDEIDELITYAGAIEVLYRDYRSNSQKQAKKQGAN